MRYVIDTSVDIKTYVQERDSSKAVRLNEYHQGVHQLIVRDILPSTTPLAASGERISQGEIAGNS